LKLALIWLVVFGHLLEPLISTSAVARTLYITFYLFHMPAFVFLSGVTSKTPLSVAGLMRLAGLLVLFQILYELPLYIHSGHYVGSPWQPYWFLWFILSLICWRALGPWFVRTVPWPLGVATAAALGVGYLSSIGYALGLSRTIVFFPLFLAGYCHGKDLLLWTRTRSWVWKMLAGSCLALAFATGCFWKINPQWLYGSSSYADLGFATSSPVPALLRMIQLTAAMVLGLALCILVPGRLMLLTGWGRGTLWVYLLHGFPVLAAHSLIRATGGRFSTVFSLAFGLLAVLLVGVLSQAQQLPVFWSKYRMKVASPPSGKSP
jgi:fucose 4-O-acetylase-like acetyltransferase